MFEIDSISDAFYGDPIEITVRESYKFNGAVTVVIGTKSYEIELVDGLGSRTITDLPAGTYKATLNFTQPTYNNFTYCESNEFIIKPVSYIDLAEIICNAEPGAVIILNRNYEFFPEYDSSLVNGIVIDKNIKIIGNNHTLDMKNAARMFNVTGGAELTIENLNLINAKSDLTKDEGSSIHAESGSLIVTDLNFANNSGKLGTIHVSNCSNLTVSGTSFTGNDAEYGCAIYGETSSMSVSESTFSGNDADNGGAIYGAGDNDRSVSLVYLRITLPVMEVPFIWKMMGFLLMHVFSNQTQIHTMRT